MLGCMANEEIKDVGGIKAANPVTLKLSWINPGGPVVITRVFTSGSRNWKREPKK